MKWESHFYYAPEIPNGLRWVRAASNNRLKAGDPAGSKKFDKGKYYYQLKLGYNNCQNHRIVWEMFNGEIPEGFVVDHIDGNPSNNTIENLRVCTNQENAYNSKKSKLNKSGISGISIKDNGTGTLYVTAQWNYSGKRCCKNFSIAKYGYDIAFELAVAARNAALKTIQETGINIHEGHGKR